MNVGNIINIKYFNESTECILFIYYYNIFKEILVTLLFLTIENYILRILFRSLPNY